MMSKIQVMAIIVGFIGYLGGFFIEHYYLNEVKISSNNPPTTVGRSCLENGGTLSVKLNDEGTTINCKF